MKTTTTGLRRSARLATVLVTAGAAFAAAAATAQTAASAAPSHSIVKAPVQAAVVDATAAPTTTVTATKVPPGKGVATGSKTSGVGGVSGAAPSTYAQLTVHGGYTASGVGLRNRGAGSIYVSGVPSGAKVVEAYLYWTILGNRESSSFAAGTFKGLPIRGIKVGQGGSPCWAGTTTGYAYRANVGSYVTGNGWYSLKGFASSRHDGADPFKTSAAAPLAEGASLVVVYDKPSYPLTQVVVANGYGMTTGGAMTTSLPFGFAASNPVGEFRTTFIGADGQANASEPFSKVNGGDVFPPDWDGTDRPIPRYSQGNLWDTDTISFGRLVHPGDTSARFSVDGGPDCISWVAQVMSARYYGQIDTDGDKLLDGWEANGLDSDGNGTFDVALPGASQVHKDLYVEMDYMGAEAVCPCHLPPAADLNRIVAAYAAAPYANNPDGLTGIRLHLDAGAARGAAFNLGGGNLVPFDADLNPVAAQFNAIKAANFNPARSKVYYYMIWAHGYDGGSSSGNAFNIPNDSFVVTLGLWPGGGSSDTKVGTFIHEFGHDLGLHHGGDDDANYEPNYLSVMNYAFQVTGIPRTGTTPPSFTYSSFTLPSLNESALNENAGLGDARAATYRTRWFCPNGTQRTTAGGANLPINWNCDGVTGGIVAANVNNAGGLSVLGTQNNWANLVYGGGTVGGGVSAGLSATAKAPQELTYQEAKEHHLHK
jgi:hypothetical protein